MTAGRAVQSSVNRALALRQLVNDYHAGQLSTPAYRNLRRRLLEAVDDDEESTSLPPPQPGTGQMRPGSRVWALLFLILLTLALVFWLLR